MVPSEFRGKPVIGILIKNLCFEIKADGEIERQQQVNQSQRKAAVKKLNALKEEIRQLAEARAVNAAPVGMPQAVSDIRVSYLADERKEPAIVSQQAGFSPDPFGYSEATGSIDFVTDKALKGIPYSYSTEVVEVYRSYNTIHVAPTGKRPQKCDGFVCLVSEGGRSRVPNPIG